MNSWFRVACLLKRGHVLLIWNDSRITWNRVHKYIKEKSSEIRFMCYAYIIMSQHYVSYVCVRVALVAFKGILMVPRWLWIGTMNCEGSFMPVLMWLKVAGFLFQRPTSFGKLFIDQKKATSLSAHGQFSRKLLKQLCFQINSLSSNMGNPTVFQKP